MNQTIPVPLWLLSLLVLVAAWAALDRLLLPSARWFLRERANRVLEEVRSRLRVPIQPFQLTRRRALIDRLVFDPEVVEAAAAFAEEERMPREVAMERVERYAREIVPAFNAFFYFRFGYWVARRVARFLFRVRLGFADRALQGEVGDVSVVFVINHRSNMDYILVSYLAATSTALSYAVGEWARIWPLESLLKAMGAYFVRRRSRNALYRAVLRRYVQMATLAGVPQAMFPEGGLSRDGTLQPAKLGLLSYMAEGFDPKGRDLLFVPVAINYDRTLEDRTLLLDLESPSSPRPGPLRGAFTAFRFLLKNLALLMTGRWYRFGYACVNFGGPLSLRDFTERHGIDFRTLERSQRFLEVQKLADELLARIGDLVPVTPVSLAATVLLEAGEQGLNELALHGEIWKLAKILDSNGSRIYLPRGCEDYAVEVGVRMMRLRRLVDFEEGVYRVRPEQVATVRYYANSIAHLRETSEEGFEMESMDRNQSSELGTQSVEAGA